MEPSLRSSNPHAVECKLRRTDPALHETIQRFVESQHTDVRISQYADLHYASKKMATNKWYWLDPMEGGRSGYLIFTQGKPVVWIDEQFKQSYRIPMRVGTAIHEKSSVLIASLNKVEGLLRLEDAWMVAGKSLFDAPFPTRWNALLDFFSNSYKYDFSLQQGLRIETAVYKPLTDALTWSSREQMPTMMIAQGAAFPRRLRVQVTQPQTKDEARKVELGKQLMEKNDKLASVAPALGPASLAARPASLAVPASLARPASLAGHASLAGPASLAIKPTRSPVTAFPAASPTKTIAIPHEEFPDTYTIMMNGVKKGYAAVQDIGLSQQLRTAITENKELAVKVDWNPEFSMYEIISLV